MQIAAQLLIEDGRIEKILQSTIAD